VEDMAPQDAALFHHLISGKMISKIEANYKKNKKYKENKIKDQQAIKLA
jgi:hypothetical protein